MSWPRHKSPTGLAARPTTVADPPGTYPVPAGRGRWRLALHERQFDPATDPRNTVIAEIIDARGRRLEQSWNGPAKLTFTLDGDHPGARLIRELQTDVMAWRWDDQSARDVLMFRGVVAQAQDELTPQANVVNYTCHDYLAMMGRRFLTQEIPTYFLATDQDEIAGGLLERASNVISSSGVSFMPGSYLPLSLFLAHEDGTERGLSGILRDRSYLGGQNLGEALDNLAQVIGGFDYDCWPRTDIDGVDRLRIWFPYRGMVRDDFALVYGSTVAGLSRTVNSGEYGNYWRVLGDNGSTELPQLWAENWNNDINDVTRNPVGLWMSQDNAADVSDVATLQEKADGDVARAGLVVPAYSVQLRPGAYAYGRPNIGDTVPLRVLGGRLDVDEEVRVLGISYSIGVDGDEDIELTVGRPQRSLGDYLTQADRDADALVRRSANFSALDTTPIGSLLDYTGNPSGPPPPLYLWADGSAYNRFTYPDLFDVTGYIYGGTGDFPHVPDVRGRMVVTTDPNRPIGSMGGAPTVGLNIAQLPPHSHPMPTQWLASTAPVGFGPGDVEVPLGPPQVNNTGPTGSGQAHENMPPWISLPKIIRAAR